jgi:hypothetical protein
MSGAAFFALYLQNIKVEGWRGQIREICIYRGMSVFGGKWANWGLDRVFPGMGIGWGCGVGFTTKARRHEGLLVRWRVAVEKLDF